ncbi:MAG: hypothetical protein KDC95_18025 [Planctomycetes bacterium]|nr:hypothetical protein [Planctomycetota bacterium]
MNHSTLIPLLIASLAIAPASRAQKTAVAVLPFDNLSGLRADPATGEMRSRIQERLGRSPDLTVLDRAQIDRYLEEMELRTSELSGEEGADEFGKLLGARLLVSGWITPADHQVARLENKSQRSSMSAGICIRAIDATNGIVVAERTYFGTQQEDGRPAKPEHLLLAALEKALTDFDRDTEFHASIRPIATALENARRIAVLPFKNETRERKRVLRVTTDKQLRRKKVVVDMYAEEIRRFVETGFQLSPGYTVLDRDRIDQALEESGLQQSGLTDASSGPLEQGLKLLGAQYLVSGEAMPGVPTSSQSGGRRQRVLKMGMKAGFRIRMTHLETGKIVFERSFRGLAEISVSARSGRRAAGDLYLRALQNAFVNARQDDELRKLLGL